VERRKRRRRSSWVPCEIWVPGEELPLFLPTPSFMQSAGED